MKRKVKLMLDSGAFSAWNQGKTIDLKEYTKYLLRNEKWFDSYVTLDVLPFGDESKRTMEMVNECARLSRVNHLKLKDKGLTPIPVFHQGEDFKYLEMMLRDDEPYIGFSTRKDLWASAQREWLDKAWSFVTDSKGRPLLKVHGFGITNPRLVWRYPWTTTDSTTWTLTPGYGQIIIPPLDRKTKQFLWNRRPTRVVVSGRSHASKGNQDLQYEKLTQIRPEVADVILKFLVEEVGVTPTEVRYDTGARRKAALIYFLRMEEHMKTQRFKERRGTLIKSEYQAQHEPIEPKFRIMFATNLMKDWSQIMNQAEAWNRLLSYYELRNEPDEIMQRYVTDGTIGSYERRVPKANFKSEAYRNWRAMKLYRRAENYNAD